VAEGFTCEVEEQYRSACKDLPKYPGTSYCVLHEPDEGKSKEAFEEAKKSKIVQKDYDFRGAIFPEGTSNFDEREFDADANFSGATFIEANFRGAKFSKGANFREAHFSGEKTDFREAYFSGERTDFTEAQLGGKRTLFTSAQFGSEERTYFSEAHFSGEWTDFSEARFSGGWTAFRDAQFNSERTDFTEAHFSGGVGFGRAQFSGEETSFTAAQFGGKQTLFTSAQFSSAYTSFESATFTAKTVRFSMATFTAKADFWGIGKNLVFCPQACVWFDSHIENPELLTFNNVRLRPGWFINNADVRKVHFTNVKWCGMPDGIPEGTLDEEIQALKDRHVESPHYLLAQACRRLSANAEENREYPLANEFHYWSMDALRKEGWRRLGLIGCLYWMLSGYGERPRRAFLVLVGMGTLFAVLYLMVAGSTEHIGQAFLYSLAAMVRLTGVPAMAPLTKQLQPSEPGLFQVLVTFEGILGPLQIALLALAIRRKVMR
jgi:uncharacterized protein YjbI with pentapeptide repeats